MKQRLLSPQAARRLLTGLLLLFMALPVAWGDTWDGKTIASSIASGEGTAEKPALITTAAELAYLAQQTNAGGELKVGEETFTDGYQDTYFALDADIDLDGRDWTPIGNQVNSFYGKFDGKEYCISNLKVDIAGDEYAYGGLFGSVQEGVIQNLGVSLHKLGINVNGIDANAGGIVGFMLNGTLRNCYVEGLGGVKAVASIQNNAGGIVGAISNTSLSHCYATVNVEASNGENYNYAGGIVGQITNDASISYTYATGSVVALGTNGCAGGICGEYFSSTPISNNLALNKEIKGNANSSHRIVGSKSQGTLSNNFASPEIVVNGKLVDKEEVNGFDGSDAINLSNYITELTKAGPLWGDNNNNANTSDDPWDSSDPAKLPKLRMRDGYDDAPAQYEDWPEDSQPDLTASQYLIADKIANTEGFNGSSWEKPIFIANRAELAYFAKQVNKYGEIKLTNPIGTGDGTTINHNDGGGTGFSGFSAYYFALSDDIELQAREWTPIGNNPNSFRGHFDGKGHVVKGLKMKMDVKGGNKYDWTFAGLFGYVVNGTLQNIGVELADEGIEVSAENGTVFAGGIAGRIDGSGDGGTAILRHCYVTGGKDAKIKITEAESAYAGGITGRGIQLNNNLTLTHCYATVDVEANGKTSEAGGIAGRSHVASYCYATGNVKANYTGGICGASTVSNCLALNQQIVGDDKWTYRIIASSLTPTSNYASSRTQINGSTITSPDPDDKNGADTWLETFKGDLLNVSGGDGWSKEKGWKWPDESSSTLLPKLMVYNEGQPYSDWLGQPEIDATDYLSNRPKPEPEPEPDPVYPPPTPIYYTVTLPQVEGATTDPGAGDYEVESWNTFRFYLTLDPDYSDSQPIVTTSRGETLTPRESDGAYLVKYVRTDVEVSIDSIRPNLPPVANEAIASPAALPRIWTEASTLCIGMPPMAPASTPVYVLTADGRLWRTLSAAPGLNRQTLPRGFYIIRVDDVTRKVIVR